MTFGLKVLDSAGKLVMDSSSVGYTYVGSYQATTTGPAYKWVSSYACGANLGPTWGLDTWGSTSLYYCLVSKSVCPDYPLVFIELDASIIAGLADIYDNGDGNWRVSVNQYGGYAKLHVFSRVPPSPSGWGMAVYDSSGNPVVGYDTYRPPKIVTVGDVVNFAWFSVSGGGIMGWNTTDYTPSAGMPTRALLCASSILAIQVDPGGDGKHFYYRGLALKAFTRTSGAVRATGAWVVNCGGGLSTYIYGGLYGLSTSGGWYQQIMIADGDGLP